MPGEGKGAVRGRWVLVAPLALGLAAGAVGWRSVASAPPLGQVETLATGPVTLLLAVNGRIAARDQVSTRAKVNGTVTRLLEDEGDVLASRGELAPLDGGLQWAMVQQAQSALGQGLALQKHAEATSIKHRLGHLSGDKLLEVEGTVEKSEGCYRKHTAKRRTP